MCIIVSKEKGHKIPDKAILENCFDNNSDGAGYMYNDNKHVFIRKGFMTFKNFWNDLLKIKNTIDIEKIDMVFHFRIGTQGGNTNKNKLRQKMVVTDIGVMHNGIIDLCTYAKKKNLSDTQIFIKDYLSILKKEDNLFYQKKSIRDFIAKVIDSKMGILTIVILIILKFTAIMILFFQKMTKKIIKNI